MSAHNREDWPHGIFRLVHRGSLCLGPLLQVIQASVAIGVKNTLLAVTQLDARQAQAIGSQLASAHRRAWRPQRRLPTWRLTVARVSSPMAEDPRRQQGGSNADAPLSAWMAGCVTPVIMDRCAPWQSDPTGHRTNPLAIFIWSPMVGRRGHDHNSLVNVVSFKRCRRCVLGKIIHVMKVQKK